MGTGIAARTCGPIARKSSISFAFMARAAGLVVTLALTFALSACGGSLFRQYEYEEETYLALDGTATVYVNASIPALAVLRGLNLDVHPQARLDRGRVRALYEGAGVRVIRVSGSRRHNRRFVHLRIEVADIRRLSDVAPFAWSRYVFSRQDGLFVFRQTLGRSAGIQIADVGWTGGELVAFRLHLPSKIRFHNARPGNLRRGNILVWEQTLTDRIAGMALDMEAAMETESILYRTLQLFAATGLVVAAMFVLIIWWIVGRGRTADPAAG